MKNLIGTLVFVVGMRLAAWAMDWITDREIQKDILSAIKKAAKEIEELEHK